MVELLDGMFSAVTGMSLTLPNIAFFIFLFWVGWLYGFLTVQIDIIKSFAAMYLGFYLVLFLTGADGIIIGTVTLGIVVHHLPKLYRFLSWARDTGDWLFALRNRSFYRDAYRHTAATAQPASSGAQTDGSGQDWRSKARSWRGGAGSASTSQSTAKQKSSSSKTSKPKRPRRTENTKRSKGHSSSRGREQRRSTKALPPPPKSYRDQNLALLGLPIGTKPSKNEIVSAYRQAVKRAHPDYGGSDEVLKRVIRAYRWLIANQKNSIERLGVLIWGEVSVYWPSDFWIVMGLWFAGGLMALLFVITILRAILWPLGKLFLIVENLIWFLYNPFRHFLKNRRGQVNRALFFVLRFLLIKQVYQIGIWIVTTPFRILTALYFDVILYLSIAFSDSVADVLYPKSGGICYDLEQTPG